MLRQQAAAGIEGQAAGAVSALVDGEDGMRGCVRRVHVDRVAHPLPPWRLYLPHGATGPLSSFPERRGCPALLRGQRAPGAGYRHRRAARAFSRGAPAALRHADGGEG